MTDTPTTAEEHTRAARAALRAKRVRRGRFILAGSASFAILGIVAVGTFRAFNPAPAPVADFAGTWETNKGQVELVQDEREVTGRYRFQRDGEQGSGLIEGEVRQGTLLFSWKEKRASGLATGLGRFALSPAGDKFAGDYLDDRNPDEVAGRWNGERKLPGSL